MTEENNGLLTTEEAAELLKLNVETVRRLLREGVLTGAKIGDNWRIRRSDIDAFWEQAKQTTK
jgi:excisionase family DNA binding protein